MAKSISFFTLPIYTSIFSRSEYGTIEMLTVISSFLGSILLMGMSSAQSMYFFKFKKEGHEKQAYLVSSILQLKLIFGTIIVVISTIISPLLITMRNMGEEDCRKMMGEEQKRKISKIL